MAVAIAAPPALPQDVSGSWIIAESGPLRGTQWTPSGSEVHIGSAAPGGNGLGVAVVAGVPTFIQWVPHVELHVFAEACRLCGPATVTEGQAAAAGAIAAAGAGAAGVVPGGPTRLQARLA